MKLSQSTLPLLLVLGLAAGVGAGCHRAATPDLPPSAPEGAPLLDQARAFMTTDEWYPEDVPGYTAVKASFKGTHTSWIVVAQSREPEQQLLVWSALIEPVPPERRAAVGDYLNQVNYGLSIGNFELDFTDGEVRFKTSVDVEGGELTETMLKNLLYLNVTTMDRYQPGVDRVVWEGADPTTVVNEIREAP